MGERPGVRIMGWDVSLNHAGFVTLLDGRLVDFRYYTDLASSAQASRRGRGHRMLMSKSKDRQMRMVSRLVAIHDYLRDLLITGPRPDYVGLEDYAIRMEQGAHYLGEVGGVARLLCWKMKVPLRLHDPISVKMFATHDGTSRKDRLERLVKERWGADFSSLNPPLPKPTKKNPKPKQNRQTSEDLADAFAIAQLVWTEIRLRDGRLRMDQLHPKEIQVFNRVTKTYPINLLARGWIEPEMEEDCYGAF